MGSSGECPKAAIPGVPWTAVFYWVAFVTVGNCLIVGLKLSATTSILLCQDYTLLLIVFGRVAGSGRDIN